MAKTITVAKITKEVRKTTGMGLPTKLVERMVKATIRNIVKSLLEGNRVKLGKITLSAKVIEHPMEKEYRNPRTGEKFTKVIEPHIQLKVNPKRIEIDEKDKLLNVI